VTREACGIAEPAGLPETEAAVLSGVGLHPRGVDAVARRSGVQMPEVLPALAMLELKSFVRCDGVGAYVRRRSRDAAYHGRALVPLVRG
jgi:predicted Rossmann fold nucleotide-binding protein DprA/Smf involved in DNA uptake